MGKSSPKRIMNNLSEINVTPFIDVCLVLLIIFMIVTPFVVKGFDVDVPPKAKDEDNPYLSHQLILTLTEGGLLFLNREPVNQPQLIETVREKFRLRNNTTIFFNGENGVSYGQAVMVLDMLKEAGAKKIGVVADILQ